MTDKTTGQFYTLLNMTDDDTRKANAALMERQIKRSLLSAIDDAERQVLAAEKSINGAYEVIRRVSTSKELDINGILGHKMKIAELRKAQALISEEYRFLFGEDIPTNI
jgi:hypothetical protein